MEPPTQLTIARIHDKYEADGKVHDVEEQKIFLCFFLKNSYSTCFEHPCYLKCISSTFNKMAHQRTTTKMSEATSMKPYQVSG
jgi:hypothetical protein